ncbi:hypothetical protein FACS1894181_04480 [Bacteroidia bacterium]|nr:hypothetical protein FACS1894181_04480 [Bacteroidia bacterium]
MKYLYLLSLFLCFVDCKGQQNKSVLPAEEPYTFQMITIPATLTSPEERAAYLVKHYWDNFEFADTSLVRRQQAIEQALVDYIDIFPYATQTIVRESIRGMLKKAEKAENIFVYFASLYERYLYEPNSPMRNDEYYIPVLETLLESPSWKEKVRPAELLRLAKLNRTGQVANNFTYTLANGQKGTLHALRSAYTLVFFYNPDCHNCQEVSGGLQQSATVSSMLAAKRLNILAIYTDADLAAWKRYLPQMPKEWTVSYDEKRAIDREELYDLKAIPSLYLLDKDKKVLLKDATFEQVENYLGNL